MIDANTDAAADNISASGQQERPFAHLHCHTHFSLLDGVNRIPELVTQVKSLGMNSVAMTDHGNLGGAMEFYNTCRKHDVKPIIGYEAYVAPGRRTDRSATRQREAQSHLTLLAMNQKGFDNLIKMSSTAYLEGFHYKPRIDRELLEEFNEGVICLSGCASSELSKMLLAEKDDEARQLVQWYTRVFGDRFYMEIQDAGFEIQKQCLAPTVDLANKMGLPLVATNDAHYLTRDDAKVQDVLLCVNTRSTRDDPNRMKMSNDGLYVCSPEEMYATFTGLEHAVARSQEIADRVDIEMHDRKLYPVYRPPEGKSDIDFLRDLCTERMHERYGDELTDEHWDRLKYELSVIEDKGYASYFLIVWDFVEFSRRHSIPCGARGSACGAIVAFLLRLGDVCPLKYDLLFERFLDPSRNEPPDIDIDFCRDRRQMVIDYTKETYGEMNVAQIGTYGTLKAKNAIRDVGRALNVPLPRVNELAKMIPDELNIKLKDALDKSPDLKAAYDRDPVAQELLDYAISVEGLARSMGTHAAGVVVADVPLDTVVPLQKITGKKDIITQWDGPTIEAIGLLKMDFLGLRNLTILDKAVKNVQRKHPEFTLQDVQDNLTDKKTFALLQRGETKGVFQLESGGMRDLLTKMKPDCFEDIIATSALYRPGPLEGGMVMEYVDVKNKRKAPRKVHPVVDEILEETYGVMVYQEQVMRILNRVGNVELASSYKCIKAISKKKQSIIDSFHDEYLAGAEANGISTQLADELWNLIVAFAGYGFNKSHSTAYGLIAYETAYLKAHYPVDFMAALLSCGMESSERISEHVDDSRRQNIAVLPPDVNTSEVEFAVVGDSISFGMAAIKGVGEAALEALVEARNADGPFSDIFDLTERVDAKALNKSALETLVKVGALDSLPGNRAQQLEVVDRAVQSAVAIARDKASGQMNLFGGDDDESANNAGTDDVQINLPDVPDWPKSQKLAIEKECLGFYLTSHPLAQHSKRIERYAQTKNKDVADMEDGTPVTIAGMVGSVKIATAKKTNANGLNRYANFDIEDATAILRCIAWPSDYDRFKELIKTENIVIIQGKVDRRGREPNIVINRIITLDQADKEFTSQVAIKFDRGLHTLEDVENVRKILGRYPGSTDVVLVVDSIEQSTLSSDISGAAGETTAPGNGSATAVAEPDKETSAESENRCIRYIMTTGKDCQVTVGKEFQQALRDTIGAEFYELKAATSSNGSSGSSGRK
ncbi:MAG: DNA polymerase III subunit alpha [Fuerstiella sp.]|nr:DNA polymerase III subunit alpha [Fuerstiella sp.]MCP4505799.1 DNA polymerase III subunit alpha [Fuerstiella sp.]